MQNEIVRLFRLRYDVPEMLGVVQLIQVAPYRAALGADQLHGVGQNTVTGLLPIKLPCVVLPGVLQEYVTLPETVRPGGAGHPQQGLVLGLVAGGGLPDNLFVNLKIVLVKGGVLAHDLFQGGQNVHVFKLVHGLTPPIPLTSLAPVASCPVPPWRLQAAPGWTAFLPFPLSAPAVPGCCAVASQWASRR